MIPKATTIANAGTASTAGGTIRTSSVELATNPRPVNRERASA